MARPLFRRSPRFGELLLVAGIVAVSVAYFLDARSASESPQNMLLIQPLTVLILGFCLYLAYRILWSSSKDVDADDEVGPATPGARSYGEEIKVGVMLALMGAYVFSLELLGMDIASVAFIGAALLLQGERRWYVVAPVSIVLGLLIVWLFGLMAPFPMTNRILPV